MPTATAAREDKHNVEAESNKRATKVKKTTTTTMATTTTKKKKKKKKTKAGAGRALLTLPAASIYRCPWVQEDKRRSFEAELRRLRLWHGAQRFVGALGV